MYASRFRSSDGFIIFVVGVAVFTDMMLYGLIVPMLPYALVDRVGLSPEHVQKWNSILLGSFGAALMLGSCMSSPWLIGSFKATTAPVILSPEVTVYPAARLLTTMLRAGQQMTMAVDCILLKLLCLVVVGWIGDRVSTRQTPFLSGLIALGISTLAIALTRDIVILLVARILQGLSSAVVATVGYAVIFDVVGTEKIGQALGYVGMSQSFGLLVGPAVGGIYEYGGYFRTFIPAFVLIAFEIALRFLVIVRTKNDEEISPQDEEGGSKKNLLAQGGAPCYGSSQESNVLQRPTEEIISRVPEGEHLSQSALSPTIHTPSTYNTITILLEQPRMLVALVALFTFNTILTAYDATVPVYIRSTFSLTSTHSSILFLIMVTPFLLSPIAGHITDHIGSKIPATLGLAILVFPVFILQYVTAGTHSPFPKLAILLAFIGSASAVALPALMAEVSLVVNNIEKQDPGIFGKQGVVAFSFGVMNFAFAGGFLAGPVLAGWLIGISGWKGLNCVLAAGGLLCFVGVGLCTGGWIWKVRTKEEESVE
ncbi:MAG: hypothetical protein L6R41_005307 [Letrouitia leprolyta]|nr:MAG: hypothetical protein L6R41_005307 [Letrouitia leprolyta]